jgi:hypothetical protein
MEAYGIRMAAGVRSVRRPISRLAYPQMKEIGYDLGILYDGAGADGLIIRLGSPARSRMKPASIKRLSHWLRVCLKRGVLSSGARAFRRAPAGTQTNGETPIRYHEK